VSIKPKTQRYLEIAAKYLPEGVTVVPVEDTGDRHRGRAHLYYGVMEVPTPHTIGRLWLYLHECAHMRLHRNASRVTHTYSLLEAEADLEVMRILDEEAISTPYRVLETQCIIFQYAVLDDDKISERHPTVTRCLEEYEHRMSLRRNAHRSL
jgi:hypothetical protein